MQLKQYPWLVFLFLFFGIQSYTLAKVANDSLAPKNSLETIVYVKQGTGLFITEGTITTINLQKSAEKISPKTAKTSQKIKRSKKQNSSISNKRKIPHSKQSEVAQFHLVKMTSLPTNKKWAGVKIINRVGLIDVTKKLKDNLTQNTIEKSCDFYKNEKNGRIVSILFTKEPVDLSSYNGRSPPSIS